MIDVRCIAVGLVGAVAIIAVVIVVDAPNAVWSLAPRSVSALAMALLCRDIPRGGRAPDGRAPDDVKVFALVFAG